MTKALVLGLMLGTAGLDVRPARTAEPGSEAPKKRAVVARSVTPSGTIIRREKPGEAWHPVMEKEALHSQDLFLGLAGAALDSKDGAVRLTFRTDLDGRSPYPIIESAVRLRDDPAVDLDFRLERGRVDLTNRKEHGPAHVRVHVWHDTWDLTLDAPGARIGLELYANWPKGVPFVKDPGPKHEPLANLVFVVLKGEVDLKHDGQQYALHAPPGPALFQWDSVGGADATPHRLEKLPDWAQEEKSDTPRARAKLAARYRFQELTRTQGPDAAIREFLNSDNPDYRRYAVFAMGALDDLKGLAKALTEAKHPDVWQNGVVALRHWIGREPGQDMKLYHLLIDDGKIPPGQAEIILQLLHSFPASELAMPETYELLIDYLGHERLAIRGLAHWHLYRLVPAGRGINYDPLAPKEERDRAQQEWRKLIPPGKLPPRPGAGEK